MLACAGVDKVITINFKPPGILIKTLPVNVREPITQDDITRLLCITFQPIETGDCVLCDFSRSAQEWITSFRLGDDSGPGKLCIY